MAQLKQRIYFLLLGGSSWQFLNHLNEDGSVQRPQRSSPTWSCVAHVLYESNLKPFSGLPVSSGFIAPFCHLGKASVIQFRLKVRSDISDVTVDGAEAWESDAPLPPQVAPGPRVNPLD